MFNPRNTDDAFAEYFGFSSPYGGGGVKGGGGPMFGKDSFGSVFSGGGARQGMGMNMRPEKAAPIENKLPCSLEELYKGATKKMKISREIADSSGTIMTVEEILTIEVKPGWKKGTKIIFREKGNEKPNIIPADLVFIIDEKPHSVYKRDGNDLIVSQKITLVEALTGCTVELTKLDGSSLTISINSTIQPYYEKVVRGEGMPLPKDPSNKGNLKIKFNFKLPTRLTAEQKTGLKRLLASEQS